MYCSADDIKKRYGVKVQSWLDILSNQDASPDEALRLACTDASAEIDGFLTLARVTLPLANIPPYVLGYACDMAAYLLMTRAGLLNSDDDGEDEIVQRAKNARSFFEKWASGGFDNGDKSGIPNARKNRVRVNSPSKMDLRGY